MSIKRNNLILAILSAYKNEKFDTYLELLNLYYKLLEQEDINDDYIEEFIYYNTISEDAVNLMAETQE